VKGRKLIGTFLGIPIYADPWAPNDTLRIEYEGGVVTVVNVASEFERPKRCDECDSDFADPPSKLCQAYREHQR
jgi:hypothetical protein